MSKHFLKSTVRAITLVIITGAIVMPVLTYQVGATVNDIVKGQKIANERNCSLCHDPTGKNDHPEAPYIVGQKKKYLIHQMKNFRQTQSTASGMERVSERHHSFMDKQATLMSDSDIEKVAEYFSSFKCIPVQKNSNILLSAPLETKKCAFCHGPTGINPYSLYPNIGGQKKSYLVRQIMEFRDSGLHSGKTNIKDKRFNRMMAPSVINLTDKEIDDIANYYSKQSCE